MSGLSVAAQSVSANSLSPLSVLNAFNDYIGFFFFHAHHTLQVKNKLPACASNTLLHAWQAVYPPPHTPSHQPVPSTTPAHHRGFLLCCMDGASLSLAHRGLPTQRSSLKSLWSVKGGSPRFFSGGSAHVERWCSLRGIWDKARDKMFGTFKCNRFR